MTLSQRTAWRRWLTRRSAMPTVSVEARSGEASPDIVVKIGTPQLEINVWISSTDVAQFDGVRRADWDSRGSLQIGAVAGAPAWWCVDTRAGTLSILVGEDDETWDVSATWPIDTLDDVIAELVNARQRS